MIILYTTHCPQCEILEKKLKAKNFQYQVCDDIDTMLMKGFRAAPNLEADGTVYNFRDAIIWVNQQEAQA